MTPKKRKKYKANNVFPVFLAAYARVTKAKNGLNAVILRTKSYRYLVLRMVFSVFFFPVFKDFYSIEFVFKKIKFKRN